VDNGGISIGLGDDEGAKLACIESKQGSEQVWSGRRLTRLRAYQAWIKKFERSLKMPARSDGTFSFSRFQFSRAAG